MCLRTPRLCVLRAARAPRKSAKRQILFRPDAGRVQNGTLEHPHPRCTAKMGGVTPQFSRFYCIFIVFCALFFRKCNKGPPITPKRGIKGHQKLAACDSSQIGSRTRALRARRSTLVLWGPSPVAWDGRSDGCFGTQTHG